jgi:MFS superfamily sulfate permease-like transporter
MYRLGWPQFLPFLTTVLAIVFTDLLTGIAIGLVVAVFFILRNNYKNAFVLVKEQANEGNKGPLKLTLSQEVSYLNKGAIAKFLQEVPLESHVIIDGTAAIYIDHDVLEVIQDFKINAPSRDIELTLVNIPAVELIQNH